VYILIHKFTLFTRVTGRHCGSTISGEKVLSIILFDL
jgi:hypothetical protein